MKERLRAELRKLEAEGRALNAFFRDDDIDLDEPSLRQLLDLFFSWETPINLEVIPGKLTDDCAALLRNYDSSMFELNQHGWQHINHEPEGRKCEFGPSRGFDEQLEDIAKGQARMNRAFGNGWSLVFTPPWNRCTENTFRALDQLGFEALSKDSGKHPVEGYKFREISITLDLYRWKRGPALKSAEDLMDELANQINELDTIGILLHHKVMDRGAFTLVSQLIETLRESPAVQIHTFQSQLRSFR